MSEKLRVGLVGWRGMVGSVLCQRMAEEGDFDKFDFVFFSTSQAGQKAPDNSSESELKDANSIEDLKSLDMILTCQGGDYTQEVHSLLRENGWKGIWVDAASTLRMKEEACLVLDPLNLGDIRDHINRGVLDYVGANCTVSLMLLALCGPVKAGLVEWVSSMTYQAASGAGARNMKELINQMGALYNETSSLTNDPASDILVVDRLMNEKFKSSTFPKELFGAPLAGSLIPWIDSPMENGQTREEWKAMAEANKIIGGNHVPIDGTCVRIGAMRSHSQGLTVKLRENISLKDFEDSIKSAHEWIEFIPNTMEETKASLSPAHFGGSLKIGVGRVRQMNLGEGFFNVFTVGDQLLWGAAEPLRRFINIYRETIS